jgi:hypothetical protein
MPTYKKALVTHLLFGGVILLLLAMGCGGGGSGDGFSYEGNREPAVVSNDNAQELVASAYDSSSLEGPFGGIRNLNDPVQDTVAPAGRPTMLAVSRVLETALFKADPGEVAGLTTVRAVVEVRNTISGACGGSASFTLQADDQSGVFSGSFNFSSYCEDDTTLDGEASFRGFIDPDTEELESFTFSFSSLRGSGDGESFRLNGQLSIGVDDAENRTVITMDLLFEDINSEESLWLNNFRVSVTERTGYEEIDISGRVYHPVHGYVDILTMTVFRINDGDDYPSQGGLVLTGADDAKIRMTALSNLQYQVEVDLDGDGTYDWGPETHDWEA